MRGRSLLHYNDAGSPILPMIGSGHYMVKFRQDRDPSSQGPRTPQLAKPDDWTVDAICWDRETHLPIPAYDKDGLSEAEAKVLCAGCPVREMCLSVTLAEEGDIGSRNRYGVRGGLNGKARAELASATDDERESA